MPLHDPNIVRRFDFHGVPLQLTCGMSLLDAQIDQCLKMFQVPLPGGPDIAPSIVSGTLRPYEQREVLRTLSPQAVRLATPGLEMGGLMELYQEDERFWLVDDRWGMAELNILKSTWRSWILPQPTLDPVRCAELAVLWPMAQILRSRGLHLLPAGAVARDGCGILILAPMGIEAELAALVQGGFRLLGQRWACIRSSGDSLEMLHMPGQVLTQQPLLGSQKSERWIDLEGIYCGSTLDCATCNMVLAVEAARRPVAHAKAIAPQVALNHLRRSWPMVELHRGHRQLPMKLASRCRCISVQLSRRPQDLLLLLSSLLGGQETATVGQSLRGAAERRFVEAVIRS